METNGAPRAQGESFAPTPSGFRRLTPGLLRADRTAESFAGLPDGVTSHGQLLAAFKAAASRLGLSQCLVHVMDWLFRFTQPQDWGRGGRPIVWPSASLQQEALGLSATRVKAINRALIEAGPCRLAAPHAVNAFSAPPGGQPTACSTVPRRQPRAPARRIPVAGRMGRRPLLRLVCRARPSVTAAPYAAPVRCQHPPCTEEPAGGQLKGQPPGNRQQVGPA